MNNKAFLDSATPSIQGYLEELWRACEQPCALYARGSTILPTGRLEHQPWDMDFVLFVAANEALATHMATETMAKIRGSASNLPPPDISIVRDDLTSPETLYALLLISVDGRLILGEDCRLPVTFFLKHSHAIWQYALNVFKSRLISFERCCNPAEQQKRAPHLAKSGLRLGGLLRMQEGNFTRKPKECATSLSKMYPLIGGSCTLLLRSLEAPIEPRVLAEACHRILLMVNGTFMNDQQRA